MGGGSLVYASKHFHYVGVYVLGWGDGKNLSQVASHRLCIQPLFFFLFFLFFFFVMKTPARGCSLPAPPPKKNQKTKRGTSLAWSGSHLASPGRKPSASPAPAPPANCSHSAGCQPPSLRINYSTGPVSLILDTFYTTLIPNINSYFVLFGLFWMDGALHWVKLKAYRARVQNLFSFIGVTVKANG